MEVVETPPVLDYLWSWFWELSNARGGGFGPAPISYLELQAWAAMTGTRPTHWEVSLLKRIDTIWLKSQVIKKGAQDGGTGHSG